MMRTICVFIFDTVVICLSQMWVMNDKHSKFHFHSIVINWIAHLCCCFVFIWCHVLSDSICEASHKTNIIPMVGCCQWHFGFALYLLYAINYNIQMNISLHHFDLDSNIRMHHHFCLVLFCCSVYFHMGWFEMLFLNARYSTPGSIYK